MSRAALSRAALRPGLGARCLDFDPEEVPCVGSAATEEAMDVLYPHCAALDVHKDTVVAAARVAADDGPATTDVRTFETTTPSLLELSAWLAEHGWLHRCRDGGDRRLLEAGLACPRRQRCRAHSGQCGAAHVKNVPGRKTDVADAVWADAVWLANLLARRTA
jgi:hypothetical protein